VTPPDPVTGTSGGTAPATATSAPAAIGEEEAALDRAEALARAVLREAGRERAHVDAFASRLRRWWPDLWDGLRAPYGESPGRTQALDDLARVLARRAAARPDALRALDRERLFRPDWFQDPSMIGYVFYTDRFSGTFRGAEDHLDYLDELGVRYVHLMPVLKPRDGDNDGGYAVADYRAVAPGLGTLEDLERLAGRLRERGISTCIDLVLNHTAAEHEWARLAAAGDPVYSEYYRIFPDRTMPDRYERTLPEVFPDFAPGNFTRLPDGRWVWTTFNEWQWDLNWANPRVFVEIMDILLEHANRGIDVFRLDAVAFMWKREGTNCQNQPEVHDLLRALRACARIAAPAVIFKAEAIVGPDDLAPYLGVGRHQGRECDLAYQNSLMVQYWSALATRDTRLMTHVMGTFPRKPATTAWGAYIRCHDDIGWAITEADAEAVGWSGPAHRAFLSAFYAGGFPGSFAVGEVFQSNPATGDSRISGTFASLAGLQRALEDGDEPAVRVAIDRMLVGNALILAWDGIPLLYMGDEIGLRNDPSYLDDPRLASDSRWLHRPWMRWDAAERRHLPGTVEQRLFEGLQRLVAVRRTLPQLHAASPLEVVDLGDPCLFAFVRRHPDGPLLAVYNLADRDTHVAASSLGLAGLERAVDALEPGVSFGPRRRVPMRAHSARWLVRG
jgi:amylosucrase